MQNYPLRVAIVGGGIGGLTTAVALGQAGMQMNVFEQAPRFKEVGAGLALGPNAVRLLRRLGLGTQLEAIGVSGTSLQIYRNWNDGDFIYNNSQEEQEVATPGFYVHRAELLTLLLDALPPERLHLGKRCTNIEQDDKEVSLSFVDGSSFQADVAIGADGIHSVVSSKYHNDRPVYSGQVAYRGLVPMERLSFLGEDGKHFNMWLGPHQHFLIYPISRGNIMNIVAFVPAKEEQSTESWSARGEVRELAATFAGWDKNVLEIIHKLDSTWCQSLYDREPLTHWSNGRITLLGDAAHAMLPHQGQGAGQSIEDAVVLTRCLQEASKQTVSQWLSFYEAQRKPRTTRVQQTTRQSGELYDLPDEGKRNIALLEDRWGWLWNYDADLAFEEARMTVTSKIRCISPEN